MTYRAPCAGCLNLVDTDQLCECDEWPGPCCLDLCCPHHHDDAPTEAVA